MFIKVPNIKKAVKEAFQRAKTLTGSKTVYLYPITENFVYVITDEKQINKLRQAKLVKKLIEKGVKDFLAIDTEGEKLTVVIVQEDRFETLEYEKGVEPLMVLFADIIKNENKEKLEVYFVENPELEDILKGAVEFISGDIELKPVKVNISENDAKELLREVSPFEKLREIINRYQLPRMDRKRTVIAGGILLLVLSAGGYYYYIKNNPEPVQQQIVKVSDDSMSINSRMASFLLKALDSINTLVVDNMDFRATGKEPLSNNFLQTGDIVLSWGKVRGKPLSIKDVSTKLPCKPEEYLIVSGGQVSCSIRGNKTQIRDRIVRLSGLKGFKIEKVILSREGENFQLIFYTRKTSARPVKPQPKQGQKPSISKI